MPRTASLLTRLFRRPAGTVRNAPRPARLRCEALEARECPAVDFRTLVTGPGNLSDALGRVQQSVDTVLDHSVAALPVIGSSGAALEGMINDAIAGVRGTLSDAVKAVNAQSRADAIGDALTRALGPAGANILAPDTGVSVPDYDPGRGSVTIDLSLLKAATVGAPFHFSLGLNGLPFQVTSGGQLQTSVGVGYDHLRFGLRAGVFFLDTAAGAPKVHVSAGAGANFSLGATVGLFNMTATQHGAADMLSADITFDTVRGTARLTGGANIDLDLVGSVGGANAVGGFKFPNVRAEFKLTWGFGASDPTAPPTGLGTAPKVEFDNVRVGFGEYMSNLLRPLTAAVQTYLTPFMPYLELINYDISGLSDVFDFVRQQPGLGGFPHATLLSIAQSLVNSGAVDDALSQAVVRYSAFLTGVKNDFGYLTDVKSPLPAGDLMMTVGSFDLSRNSDLRSLLSVSSALVPALIGGAQHPGLLAQLDASGDAGKALGAAFNRLNTEVSLTFPFTDNPVSGAFGMLLGRQSDLVRFTFNLPSVFNANLQKLMDRYGGPVLGSYSGLPATGRIDGDLNVDAYVAGGYDTKGLLRFLSSGGDAAQLADGFYFDSSKPIIDATGSIGLAAGPVIGKDLGFAKAEIGIEGRGDFNFQDLSLRYDDPDADGDHKFRPFGEDAGQNLFAAGGALSGGVSIGAFAEVGALGHNDRIALGPQFSHDFGTLFDFASKPDANPFRPVNVAPGAPAPFFYDFAQEQPALATDGKPDTLLVSLVGNSVQIYSGDLGRGGLYRRFDNLTPATQVMIAGSRDGTTFVVSPSAAARVRIIGQGNPGKTDVLRLGTGDFALGDSVQVDAGGIDAAGAGAVTVRGLTGPKANSVRTLTYTGIDRLEIHAEFARSSVVNLTGAWSAPVEVDQSAGADTVNLALAPGTLRSQSITIHGGGGADALNVTKPVYTTLGGGALLRPTDEYTIDANRLTYRSHNSGRTYFPGGTDSVVIGAGALGAFPVGIDVAFDGLASLAVDQAVVQSATFDVRSVTPATQLTLHGPLATTSPYLTAAGTYTFGSADHNLDAVRGRVVIDDRTGTGAVVLDDSAADPVGHAANSGELAGVVSTTYDIGPGAVSGGRGVRRTRAVNYQTRGGPAAEYRSFSVELNREIGNFQLLTGGGTNTTSVRTAVAHSVAVTGGPGADAVVCYPDSFVDDSDLSVTGGGGSDTFRVDDSAVSDVAGAEPSTHHLSYTVTNATMASGSIVRSDRVTGAGLIGTTAIPYDYTTTRSVSFSGFEAVAVCGAAGSQDAVTVVGNTGANLSVVTGNLDDTIAIQAPAPTAPRGGLYVEAGFGADVVTVATGTLDYADLQVYGQPRNMNGYERDTVSLDDSASTTGHTYVVGDARLSSRDGKRVTVTGGTIALQGGSGNDVFNVVSRATWPLDNSRPASQLTISGGAGDDSFVLATDAYEGTSKVRTLDYYAPQAITLYGDAGTNSVLLDDSGSRSPHTYAVSGDSNGLEQFWRDGGARMNMYNAGLSLRTGTGADTIFVPTTAAGVTTSITAGAGDVVTVGEARLPRWTAGYENYRTMTGVLGNLDIVSTGSGPSVVLNDVLDRAGRAVVVGGTAAAGYAVSGLAPGTVTLRGAGFAAVDIRGGSGDDTYTILAAPPALHIDAGLGNDTLDYSSWTTGVTVNLAAGTATAVGRGVSGFENVYGGAGNDTLTGDAQDNVLVGNAGDDVLIGGDGNDLLVGGAGNDNLYGGAGYDLLVAGSLLGGVDLDRPRAVEAIWARPDLLLPQRGRALVALYAASPPDAGDSLVGGDGADWFWAAAPVVVDYSPLDLDMLRVS